MSGTFAGERALVVGLGVAGSAAARALAIEGATVRVVDRREDATVSDDLRGLGVDARLGEHAPGDLDGVTLVVTSPAPYDRILSCPKRYRNDSILSKARRDGLPVPPRETPSAGSSWTSSA